MGQGLKQGGQVLPSNSVHSKLGNPYKSNRKNNDQRERITSIKPLLQFETGGVHFPSGLNFASGHLFYATVCFSITNNEVNRQKMRSLPKQVLCIDLVMWHVLATLHFKVLHYWTDRTIRANTRKTGLIFWTAWAMSWCQCYTSECGHSALLNKVVPSTVLVEIVNFLQLFQLKTCVNISCKTSYSSHSCNVHFTV